MKKIVIIFVLLACAFIVHADNEYGNILSGGRLLYTDVDVKVDDKWSRNVEYAETLSQKADKGSKLTFYVRVFNNHTTLKMENVELVISIEDLDLETSDEIGEIKPLDDNRFELELTLPNDVDEENFEILMEIKGEQNLSIHKNQYKMDFDVEYPVEEDAFTETNYERLCNEIKSLNNTIKSMHNDINGYFEPYTKCVAEKQDLQQQITTKDSLITELQPFKAQSETCNNEKQRITDNLDGLQQRYQDCMYNNTNILAPKAASAGKYNFLWIIGGILSAVVILYLQKAYSTPKSEVEEESEVG